MVSYLDGLLRHVKVTGPDPNPWMKHVELSNNDKNAS